MKIPEESPEEELGRQLRNAAGEGDLALVGKLLLQGVPVDATDSTGWTPLMFAALRGHTDTCRLLLDNKASVDAKCRAGETPLMLAALGGHTDTCRLLLDNKASVDAQDNIHPTLLIRAVCRTPLMCAANRGRTDTCGFLIDTIVTQIKNSKANAIALLGLRNRGKISCLNPIDKNVIRLIAREVRARQQRSLFAQIGATENDEFQQELLAYAQKKLNATSNSNQGKSDE